MIDPAPHDYATGPAGGARTSAVIQVDATLLRSFGKEVETYLKDIGDDVTTIFTTLKELKLGWAGRTQQEAEDFFDRLDACLTALYGKSGDEASEKSSLLTRVAGGLQIAGANYLSAEDDIVKLFSTSGLGTSDPNAPKPGPYDSHTWTNENDPTKSSVSENF
ncbi:MULTISPECIES: WXG100 family type VII secretion target [Streptomycetaceae]|uniref:WXG100 family type VII secretion target n=1 Tax=Streptantibioticus cattleyicolor (strain ATCC 35852 / DSM 46488 / JCM 4925 / NBRC 14057 / NRRL 8057) TaxID=1003195 RepID=F8JY86_STREN|nr:MULTISPECIES: WXG100 family type VII secretion target [Streptomycetaceae]AEW94672.1 hypothetical protein SCATT_23010 [Streptantibioticus cattleyicolor NRRL 8057 = DSM 46488]MYS59307.1 hypothetical protein [Streptomyces sp. SID5468]CCB75028.1 protein of unknown function [Streptantibioticus cattleyicolor NRRL 8057 = DSM 46488]